MVVERAAEDIGEGIESERKSGRLDWIGEYTGERRGKSGRMRERVDGSGRGQGCVGRGRRGKVGEESWGFGGGSPQRALQRVWRAPPTKVNKGVRARSFAPRSSFARTSFASRSLARPSPLPFWNTARARLKPCRTAARARPAPGRGLDGALSDPNSGVHSVVTRFNLCSSG